MFKIRLEGNYKYCNQVHRFQGFLINFKNKHLLWVKTFAKKTNQNKIRREKKSE
jgi:hypothetical protein